MRTLNDFETKQVSGGNTVAGAGPDLQNAANCPSPNNPQGMDDWEKHNV